MSDEAYVRYLSRYFFAPGYDAEDMAQEARLAMWLAEERWGRLAARRRLIEIVRRELRGGRPTLVELAAEAPDPRGLEELVAARERLREALAAPLTDLERAALGRAIRGEGCTSKPMDNALQRARKKLAA